jgi:precorrin-2 dehydrogenase/sirohydrochlorin ferrochelatase
MKRLPPAKVFPLFLKLKNRPCLVVGAGNIAESKIEGLVQADATVRVVAPEATPKVCSWANDGKIDWQRRDFQASDLRGMFLVVAATSSTPVHEHIFSEAQSQGVLCNVVDVPHLCDFYYPAVVRRGSLQIAISTAGESPALSQRLRKELEVQFGPEYGDWVESIGSARADLGAKNLSAEERKQVLHEMATEKSLETFRKRGTKTSD